MEAIERADAATGEVMIFPGTMPSAIAAAIIGIKKQVKSLGSDEKNQHGGYSYVSVDKFYDRIGKLMAEAGLALMIDETSSDVREGKSGNPWLFVRYSLAFVHESGVMSFPVNRSCSMPISGPQAYGAIQSYIEKQFLRQVFKVPTGEKDADGEAPKEGEAPSRRGGQRPAQTVPAQDSDAKADARARYNQVMAAIAAAPSADGILALKAGPIWAEMREKVQAVEPKAAFDGLMARLERACEARISDLESGSEAGYGP